MSEYFSFRKRSGETIGQFLVRVRETLGFKEFHEAPLQLKDERDGIDPAQRVFDLPDLTGDLDEEDDGGWRYWHRRDDWRAWQQWPDAASVGSPHPDADEYEPVPSSEPKAEKGPTVVDETSPDDPVPSPSRSAVRPSSMSPKKSKPSVKPGGLSPMDTFILDVLRGWRLLVAASLSSEEWRDVLATTTNNKLDYLSVSDALQTLWDEQMGSGRWASGSSQQHQQFWAETAYDPSWYDSFQASVWQPSWSEDWSQDFWNDWEAHSPNG